MKIAAVSATALALLAAGAAPSFAHDYPGYGYEGGDDACQARQHDNGATGAVLGGLAGALLGSNLASHHGGRGGGAALGAVAGAVIGNSIGRSSAKSSDTCQARDAYGPVAYRRAAPYAGYAPAYGGDYYRSDYRPRGYERQDGDRGYGYGYGYGYRGYGD